MRDTVRRLVVSGLEGGEMLVGRAIARDDAGFKARAPDFGVEVLAGMSC
jgi:hypothetical protein